MDQLAFFQWSLAGWSLLFTFAFGAIVGSFLNVVVYRLPKGLNLVTPPSACPACETRLSWRQNVPIFGWLRLGGKCAFCKSKISPEYPLVELTVALLFSAVYLLWFFPEHLMRSLGADWSSWRPEWAADELAVGWPYALLILLLFATLVAITLIDAKTFLIPLELPWFIGLLGLIVHPLHALWLTLSGGAHRVESLHHVWTIPVAEGPLLGASLLGGLGIVIAALLLWKNVMPRSFADFDAWEKTTRAEAERARDERAASTEPPTEVPPAPRAASSALRGLILAGPGVAFMFLGMSLGLADGLQKSTTYGLVGLVLGLLVGFVLRRIVPSGEASTDHTELLAENEGEDDLIWTMYPHARREMAKEVLFLLPAMALALLGWWLCSPGGPLGGFAADPPLALKAFGGAVLGLLVGGGLVWAVRILGSLAFNKEAMGLGDVHLMAGVGAVLGWVDPTLAFFMAPFTGILWVLLSTVSKALFNRAGAHLPYGPQLALMTIVVVLCKPWVESGLGMIMRREIDLP